jgi:hypothetical protein
MLESDVLFYTARLYVLTSWFLPTIDDYYLNNECGKFQDFFQEKKLQREGQSAKITYENEKRVRIKVNFCIVMKEGSHKRKK